MDQAAGRRLIGVGGLLRRLDRLLSRSKGHSTGPNHVYAMRLEQGKGIAGSIVRLSPDEGEFSQATIHPGGRQVAFWGLHPDVKGGQIWIADIADRCCRPLTLGPAVHGHPGWWPDGRSLVCFATRDEVDWRPERQFDTDRPPSNLYRLSLDGLDADPLTDGPWIDERPTVTPDGKAVIFVSNRAGSGLNLWALDVASGDLRSLTHGSALDYRPVVAPDCASIAYFTATDQGRHRLALISWPEAAPLTLSLRRSFTWIHGPWWTADSRHVLVHGLVEGDARPALWLLDSIEGGCMRVVLPGVRESSHGTLDDSQSWLAFDSRQRLPLAPADIITSSASSLHRGSTRSAEQEMKT